MLIRMQETKDSWRENLLLENEDEWYVWTKLITAFAPEWLPCTVRTTPSCKAIDYTRAEELKPALHHLAQIIGMFYFSK